MSDMDTKVARAALAAEEEAAQVDGEAAVGPVGRISWWDETNTRTVALDKAMDLHTSGVYLKDNGDISTRVQATREDVVATAEAFLAFLTGGAK